MEKCKATKRVEFGDQFPTFEVTCKKQRDHIITALDQHLASITLENNIWMDISWEDDLALRAQLRGAFVHALRGTQMNWPGMSKNRNTVLEDLIDAAMKVMRP